MFIAILSIIVETTLMSTKMAVHVHTQQHIMHTTTWVNRECITLGERSQRQETTYYL